MPGTEGVLRAEREGDEQTEEDEVARALMIEEVVENAREASGGTALQGDREVADGGRGRARARGPREGCRTPVGR
jgi:hypothetical protein